MLTNLGTRQDSYSLKLTTIDLTIMPPLLGILTEKTKGPHIGSDHVSKHINIQAKAYMQTPMLKLRRRKLDHLEHLIK